MKRLILLLATAWLTSLAVLLPPSPSRADTVVVTGTDGAPGAPGSGLPGADGQSATATATATATLVNNATALGGNGGDGGSSSTQPTGAGGNGGDAVATATAGDLTNIFPSTTRAIAVGGAGGSPGGDGGSATATSTSIGGTGRSTSLATATGGDAQRRGGSGNGGDAQSFATLQIESEGSVNSTAVGGNDGGSGQRGGDATAISTALSKGPSTMAQGVLHASAIATAGGGLGAQGGNAIAQIHSTKNIAKTIAVIVQTAGRGPDSHMVNSSSFQTSGDLDLTQRAIAGTGREGDASSVFDFVGPGALTIALEAKGRAALTGADLRSSSAIDATLFSEGYESAMASISAITDTASAVTLNVDSVRRSGALAGFVATLGPIYGESAGGDVTVSGFASSGLSPVSLVNAVDGQTSGGGRLTLRQDAVAGGTVHNELRKSASVGALSVTSTAVAGTASSIAEANNDAGAASATSDAGGGSDATSLAVATTTGSGHDVTVTGAARGRGIGISSGSQGNARSESRGTAVDGAVTVQDAAVAGSVGIATSRAIGINSGTASVNVSSVATGIRGGGAIDARATASSQGHATADASALRAFDPTDLSRALAEASGASGHAAADAEMQWIVPTTRRITRVTGDAMAAGSGAKSALVTLGGDGTPVPVASALRMHQAFSVVDTQPATSQVLASLATNPNVAGQIGTGPGTTLLALGVIGAASAMDATGISTSSAQTRFSVSFRDAPLSPGDQLKLGFLDADVRGSGFDSVRLRIVENQLVFFDQTFTSVAAALAFFDDQTLDLATPLPGNTFPLDIQILLEVTTSSAGQGFGVGLLAAFVPEPGLGLFLLIAALAWKPGRSAFPSS